MALSKTDRARAALQAQVAAGLSLAERRVLILCDGRRNRDDIVALLGANALSMIERLLQEDYLSLAAGSPVAPRLVASEGQPVEAPVAAAAAASRSVQPTPHTQSRRSLAASKMYLVDMLQLQRDPESMSLRAEIQTSPSEEELVYRMMKGLHHLQSVAAASYARRVGDRLAEILPDQYLPRFDQVRGAWIASLSAVA